MSNARNLSNLLGTGTTIATASIADDAVTSAKIADDAVVAAAIADSAVDNARISNSTIDLTAKVTGSLPLANGGTALTRAPYYCGAYLTATTGGILTVNTTVTCPLNGVHVDNASAFNTSTHKYVVPSAGKYMVIAKQMVTHNSGSGQSNQFHFYILLNGSVISEAQKDGNGNYDWQEHGTTVVTRSFSANDEITIAARVSTGSGTTNYRYQANNSSMTIVELFGV